MSKRKRTPEPKGCRGFSVEWSWERLHGSRKTFLGGKNEREKELSFLESRGYKMLVKEKEEYRIWYDALEIMDLFIGGNAENENND